MVKNKMRTILVITVILAVALLGTLLAFTIKNNWSPYIIISFAGIFVLFGLIYFIATKIKQKKVDETKEEKPKVTKDEVEKSAISYIKHHDYLADNSEANAYMYVPPQEGSNKVGYWIIKLHRYYHADYVFAATRTDKIDFEQSQRYDADNDKNKSAFEQIVNNSVINPAHDVIHEEVTVDQRTGEQRTIRTRTPAEVLHKAEEEKQIKKAEEEEGIVKEE